MTVSAILPNLLDAGEVERHGTFPFVLARAGCGVARARTTLSTTEPPDGF